MPKLCPKYVGNIKAYLTISKSIEVLGPEKLGILQFTSIIFYIIISFASIAHSSNLLITRGFILFWAIFFGGFLAMSDRDDSVIPKPIVARLASVTRILSDMSLY